MSVSFVLQAVLLLLLPWAARYISARFVSWLSPVVICYALGLVLGNLPGLAIDTDVAKELSEIMVPLSIPLLLFSSRLSTVRHAAKPILLSFLFCLAAAAISSTLAYYWFKDDFMNAWKMAGMTVGVYTGGTPNMAAIGQSLEVDNEVFVLLNGSDLILGGLYLLFLLSIAQRVLGSFLPVSQSEPTPSAIESTEQEQRFHWSEAPVSFGISALITGLVVGASLLTIKKISPVFVMVGITSLGLVASFIPKVRSLGSAYTTGEYLLLVFCIAVGAMCKLDALLGASLNILGFAAVAMFGAVVLHWFFAFVFRIDRDSTIISSTAAIYGTPFIGAVAAAMGNRAMVAPGLIVAVLGYAIANYWGLILAYLLKP